MPTVIDLRKKRLNDSSNCLVCLTYFMYLKSSLGLPILGFCKHKNSNYNSHPKFRIFKPLLVLNCIVHVSFFALDGLYIVDSINKCVENTRVCLEVGSECVIVSFALCLIFFAFLKVKYRVSLMNTMSHLMSRREFYGVGEIISGEQIKRWNVMNILIFGWEIFFSSVYFFIKYDKSRIYWTICLVIGFHIQMDVMFQIKFQCLLMKKIYSTYFSHLKQHMLSVLSNNAYTGNMSLLTRLKKFEHAHMKVIKIYKNSNNFLDPASIIWSMSICSTLIVNIYIVVVTKVERSLQEIISSQFFAYLSTIGLINICFDVQGMNYLVSI